MLHTSSLLICNAKETPTVCSALSVPVNPSFINHTVFRDLLLYKHDLFTSIHRFSDIHSSWLKYVIYPKLSFCSGLFASHVSIVVLLFFFLIQHGTVYSKQNFVSALSEVFYLQETFSTDKPLTFNIKYFNAEWTWISSSCFLQNPVSPCIVNISEVEDIHTNKSCWVVPNTKLVQNITFTSL